MPSDPRMEMAMVALADPIARYRSAVAATVEELRGYLSNLRAADEGVSERPGAELGHFAEGRIDLERFADLLTNKPVVDPATMEGLSAAFETLSDVAAEADDLFRIDVKSGGRLRDAVVTALENAGRAFGAARVARRATLGSLRSGVDDHLLGPMGFERWSEAERQLAPPLAIEIDGADLHAAGLAEFLDKGVKIVLVVRGPAPPAPLVRLITPGTFVLQTADEAGLERFGDVEGGAIAAIVPEGCALFIHDPAGGDEPWERIEIIRLPEAEPSRPIGGMSRWQLTEELRQLASLDRTRARAVAATEAGPAAAAARVQYDPAEKLAAWLLSQADLSGLAS